MKAKGAAAMMQVKSPRLMVEKNPVPDSRMSSLKLKMKYTI